MVTKRYLKLPENILLDPTRHLKISDFGTAEVLKPDGTFFYFLVTPFPRTPRYLYWYRRVHFPRAFDQ
jgi:serine/threonine protein kinase